MPLRLAALAVVALVAAGCDTGDGRDLAEPAPGATAPPMPSSTTATSAGGAVLGTPPVGSAEDAGSLVLRSPAFAEGAPIPAAHSCDGDDVAPPLAWTGVPEGTVELAVTVVDPDAPGAPFVHQLLTGIDPVVTGIGEGGVPESAVEVQRWSGPCPPAGEVHRYEFTLYALTAPTGVGPDTTVEDALAALESTPGPTARLTGTYGRAG